jgi:methionyl-tRNA synthetase
MAEAAEKAKAQAQLPEMKKDIRIDVFDKVDLRVAQIKAADHVEGADKLLKFQLDDGTAEGRQILSGIAQWYPDPSVLVGKKVLIVANLKPRKMRGELSQGMILSDEDAAGNVQVVTVPENMQPGTTVC